MCLHIVRSDGEREGKRSFKQFRTPMARKEMTDQDAVTSWLQDREMKDHKLGAARSERARTVDIRTAIGRMQEKAYLAFPQLDRSAIDAFVRDYVDPKDRSRSDPPK